QARAAAASTPAVPAAPASRDRTRPAPLPSAHESEVGVPGAVRAAASATPARPTSTVAVRDLASRIADVMGTPRPAPAAASNSGPTPASGRAPVPESAKPAVKREAAEAAVPLPVSQALLPLAPLPLPAGVKRPAAPAACAPSGISAKECKALDNHSVALSSKLAELEGKMKALQGAIKATAGAPAPAPVAATAPAPKVAQAGTAVLAAAGSSVAAAVATPAATAHEAPKSASVASAAPGPASVAEKAAGKSAEGKSEQSGKLAAGDGASASASAATGSASATASADGHGANVSASAAGASASATAPVPLKRVLPKLKYKKEKPIEHPPNYAAWGAGAVGVLMLAGAGLLYLRRKKSGAAPLKIWQGFRRKKPAEPGLEPQPAQPLHEVTPESIMQ
ncbi:MAG TPA: GlyGly-CTERM sorting domain-containing protein, partial [Duganella sp.]|uniref:GlyGly-CTERM sorting domain-containing protein n=1 Tax=Duganella sp. TaxID=1904440 RepID=UPI002ED287BF